VEGDSSSTGDKRERHKEKIKSAEEESGSGFYSKKKHVVTYRLRPTYRKESFGEPRAERRKKRRVVNMGDALTKKSRKREGKHLLHRGRGEKESEGRSKKKVRGR